MPQVKGVQMLKAPFAPFIGPPPCRAETGVGRDRSCGLQAREVDTPVTRGMGGEDLEGARSRDPAVVAKHKGLTATFPTSLFPNKDGRAGVVSVEWIRYVSLL